jgi:branched-chain amino acid transport system ATP-binding protein
MDLLLQGASLSRSFGGVRALDSVDFHLLRGEVLGVIGPNGSGKTTLINLIAGNVRPSSGEIRFRGRVINGLPAHRIARLGIARSFQVSRAFLGMTVAENILVGALFGFPLASRNHRTRMSEVEGVLKFIGLEGRRDDRVEALNVPDRKKVDLGRAIAMKPDVLLLDELMAGLNPTDTEHMIGVIREIGNHGVTLVVIEHVMNVIVSLCSRVLVLHHGQKIADGAVGDVMRDRIVLEAYLGSRFTEEGLDRAAPRVDGAS